MLKSCNVLVAQTSMEEKQMDYIRKEAAKGDVEIIDMKKALSVREVQKCLKETENGEPKYTVLIIQQRLDQSKELVSPEELKKMRMMVPMLRILLCTSKDMAGSTYLQQVFEAGVYTAFYEEDGTMKNIVELIRNGRSAKKAIAYYQISEDNPDTRKQIGYIEEARLKKLLKLVHSAKDNELDDVLKHIRTMLTKKELLYLISNMNEEDVKRVFFKKGMGVFFDQEKYKQDLKDQESGGLLKRFKKTELHVTDYILEPDELDARIELVRIKREARLNKEQTSLAKQESQIEKDMRQEDPVKEAEDTPKEQKEVTAEQETPEQKEQESAGSDLTEEQGLKDMQKEVSEEPEKPSEDSPEPSQEESFPSVNTVENTNPQDTPKENTSENVSEKKTDPTEDERLAALQTLFGPQIDAGTATALLKALQQNNAPVGTDTSSVKSPDVIPDEKMDSERAIEAPKNDPVVEKEPGIEVREGEKDEDTTVVETDFEDEARDTPTVEKEETSVNEDETVEQESKTDPQTPVVETSVDVIDDDTAETTKKATPVEQEEEEFFLDLGEESKETEEDIVRKRKEELSRMAKTPLVFSPLTIKDENAKVGKIYYVISGGKHSGATTMSSVLAYTYKQKYKDKRVCVCSYDGNIDDYANLVDEQSDETVLNREENKMTYNDVDFYVVKRSEILGLKSEYDALFIDMKGIGQFNKNYKKESVFLVTQGSAPQLKGLQKTSEKVKEIGLTDVSVIASLIELNDEQKNTVRELLDCPVYNIGYLRSFTKHCSKLRNSF